LYPARQRSVDARCGTGLAPAAVAATTITSDAIAARRSAMRPDRVVEADGKVKNVLYIGDRLAFGTKSE
jgi:hypothetical protein